MSDHTVRCVPARPCSAKSTRFRPRIEALENRLLMTATDQDFSDLLDSYNSLNACGCPICTGKGLEFIPVQTVSLAGTSNTKLPLSSLPILNSLPSATAKLFLDFNGSTTGTWGSYSNVSTPVYDRDGDALTFSTDELVSINEIWQRVAEDFAPFNINVTTVDPGNSTDKVTARLAIGGNYTDWFQDSAGGVAYVGGFYNSASNTGFVFEDALGNGNPKYVAEAASHEAGHLFGLSHQSVWSGNTLVESYSTGSNGWAPVMGVGYYQNVTTWHNGSTPSGANATQDDLAILSGVANGFGYRTDEYGNTQQTAYALNTIANGGTFSVPGLISTNSDIDVFSFSTSGGNAIIRAEGVGVGQNFDAVLELRNASGSILATANTSALNESISKSLSSGTYYVFVRSTGAYGRIGQYTLSGNFASAPVKAPEISVTVANANIESGGAAIDFGNIALKTSATRTFVVRNEGTSNLTLTALNSKDIPAGFVITSNLKSRTLRPGASTSFTIGVTTKVSANYSGTFTLASNDADESAFTISLAAVVGSGSSSGGGGSGSNSVTVIDDGQAGFTTKGAWKKYTGAGNGADRMIANKGTGTSQATWQFNGLAPGRYRISATWVADKTLATNARYEVRSGSKLLGSANLNQEKTPSSLTTGGTKWQDIGYATVTGNSITVTLTNKTNDKVMVDAIRIERVSTSSSKPVNQSFSLKAPVVEYGFEDFEASEASEQDDLDGGSLDSNGSGVHSAPSTATTDRVVARVLQNLDLIDAAFAELGAMDDVGSSSSNRLKSVGFWSAAEMTSATDDLEQRGPSRSLAQVLEVLETSLDDLEVGE